MRSDKSEGFCLFFAVINGLSKADVQRHLRRIAGWMQQSGGVVKAPKLEAEIRAQRNPGVKHGVVPNRPGRADQNERRCREPRQADPRAARSRSASQSSRNGAIEANAAFV